MQEDYVDMELDEVRAYQRNVSKFQGIVGLSKVEIKKDLREIERLICQDDTDSDCSIKSEDILPSTYPVKPRKTPRASHRNEIKNGAFRQNVDQDKELADAYAAEEALEYIKGLKAKQQKLYDAELDREKLETQLMAYQNMKDDCIKRFGQRRKEQENFTQLLQVLHAKQLRIQTTLNKQNSMVRDVLIALQRKQTCAQILENDISRLKSIISGSGRSARSVKNNAIVDSSVKFPEGETAVCRVHLNKSNKEVLLYKSQWIKTPLCEGQIESINPHKQQVIIKLSFGKMYAHLGRVAAWGSTGTMDATSDEALIKGWKSMNNSINMPLETKLSIRALVSSLDDEDAMTDRDDDTSGDDVAVSPDDMPMEVKGFGQENSLSRSSQDSVTSKSDGDRVDSNQVNEAVKTTFGILPVGTANNTRQALKKLILDDTLAPAVSMERLPLAFAPPASLPYVVERLEQKKGEHGACLELCSRALDADGSRIASIGSLAWNGNLEEMRNALKSLGSEIRSLEKDQQLYVSQVDANLIKSNQLNSDAYALRLAMFTRRVLHRNNLTNQNLSCTCFVMNGSSVSSSHVRSISSKSNISNGSSAPSSQLEGLRAHADSLSEVDDRGRLETASDDDQASLQDEAADILADIADSKKRPRDSSDSSVTAASRRSSSSAALLALTALASGEVNVSSNSRRATSKSVISSNGQEFEAVSKTANDLAIKINGGASGSTTGSIIDESAIISSSQGDDSIDSVEVASTANLKKKAKRRR